ncbi:MAG: hypothetical protein ACRCXZ_07330 [Patescibacteria group bacterium]
MTGIFAYHIVPQNQIGDYIIPLNQLKELDIDLYNFQIKKYVNRLDTLETKVINGYKWPDVSFFTIHDPEVIFGELRNLGFNFPKVKMYKIPLSYFSEESIIWLYTKRIERDYIDSNEIIHLKDIYTINTNAIPKKTLNYYQDCRNNNTRPLLYAYVPHLLAPDKVYIRDVEIIEV